MTMTMNMNMTMMKEASEGRRKRLRPRIHQEPRPLVRTAAWHMLCCVLLLLATTFLGTPSSTTTTMTMTTVTMCTAFPSPTVRVHQSQSQSRSPSKLLFLPTRRLAAVDSDASEGSLLSGGDINSRRNARVQSDAAGAGSAAAAAASFAGAGTSSNSDPADTSPASTPTSTPSSSSVIRNNDNANADAIDNANANDLATYAINLQIAELAKQCAARKNATAAVQAVQLLRSMAHPDTVAYNTVLKVLAKLSPYKIDGGNGGNGIGGGGGIGIGGGGNGIGGGGGLQLQQKQTAASLALSILDEMKELYQHQLAANQEWYTTRMAAASDHHGAASASDQADGPPRIRVKPNVRSYSTVMDALARNGKVESAEQAEALLAELHDAYYETDDWAMQPNLITYNTVLTAWARAAAAAGAGASGGAASGGAASASTSAGSCSAMAAEHCVRILEYMPVAPDTISYNTVLHAVARSGWDDSGERAEGLLRSMKDQGVAVNARSYTTCMDAWSQSGCPDRAERLLREMEDLYESTQKEQLKPNTISYSTVIHAYASSPKDHPDKANAAYRIFQTMRAKGVPPNTVTYNNLLNCLATSMPQPELIVLVSNLYQQVLTEDMADHYTFGTVLKACCNLLWKDAGFAPAVFREACERGHVSSGVLWQLRQAVPVDTYRELVGKNDQIVWTELPPKWTRNVRDDRMRRKRW